MKHVLSLPQLTSLKRTAAAGGISLLLCLGTGATASAGVMYPGPAPVLANAITTSPTNTQSDATRTKAIIAAGNREINRRLTKLGTLSSKISSATKLSSTDKTTLLQQVNSEISNLTALKAKLDAETTFAGAKADAQSIVSDYRVYALIVPKIQLLRVADDEQVTAGKLTALADKLQTRISQAETKGKDVSALNAKLADLKAQAAATQSLAAGIESKVINLQPSDYNSNHTVLSGDAAQLKTGHADNQAAYNDAKAIVSGLKSL